MRWLWGNWELKLVSLVVALALWTYTSGQVRVERQVRVVLRSEQIRDLPSGLQAAGVEPEEFVAVLSVPTSELASLREGALRPVIALRDRREPGRVELPLTGRLLGLDSDLRLLRTEPAGLTAITVRLSAIATAMLPAEAPAVAGLPAGIAAEVVLDRTQVEVSGPREMVQQAESDMRQIRFAPVRLAGIDAAMVAPREERVALVPLPDQPQPVQPVHARIVLKPARSLSLVLRAPVAVLFSPSDAGRWRLEAEPQVELRLTGPEAAIRALRGEDLVAWVDLHAGNLAEGERILPVSVQLPPGIAAEPAQVAIRLRPAGE